MAKKDDPKGDIEKIIKDLKATIKEIDKSIKRKISDDMQSYTIKTELRDQSVDSYKLKDLSDLKKDYMKELRIAERELDRINGLIEVRVIVPRFPD